MATSYPHQNKVTLSFRCSESLKVQMWDAARASGLSNSELIRYSIEVMVYLLNNPDICERAGGKLRELIYVITSVTSTGDKQVADEAMPNLLSTVNRQEIDLRNIKCLNRDEHGFDGCRVALVRNKHRFVRYFSAKEYGDVDTALAAALEVRDYVLEQLLICPKDMVEVFAHAMKIAPPPCSCRNGRALQFKSAFSYI